MWTHAIESYFLHAILNSIFVNELKECSSFWLLSVRWPLGWKSYSGLNFSVSFTYSIYLFLSLIVVFRSSEKSLSSDASVIFFSEMCYLN